MSQNGMSSDLLQDTNADGLSKDDVFDILSNARRRYVLYHLREERDPVELGDLARELAAWENETTVEELTKQQRKRVYVSLYQTHIQKLQEAGIVEYDEDSGKVSLGSSAAEIGAHIALEDSDEDGSPGWAGAYAALAGIGLVLYALTTFEVFVFGLLSEFLVGVAIFLGFACLATVHYLSHQRSEPDIPTAALVRDRE